MIPEYKDVKFIWWDLDDTLWDFAANSREALDEVYDDLGLAQWFPTAQEWRESYHVVNSHLWDLYNRERISMAHLRMERFRETLSKAGCRLSDSEYIQMDMHYLRLLGRKSRLVKGACEALMYLYDIRNYRMGILSNGFADVQYQKLVSSGIADVFEEVVLSDEAGYNKPDVRIFRYAERIIGMRPKSCLMIGDNPLTDIAGAKAASWHTLLYDPTDSFGETCAHKIKSLSEVASLL